VDNGCREREKIVEEADRNFMREEENEKKDRNNCIWVLNRDSRPDFRQIVRSDGIRPRRKRGGVGETGGSRYLKIGEDHNDNNA